MGQVISNGWRELCMYLFPEKHEDIDKLLIEYTELSKRRSKCQSPRTNHKYNEILKTLDDIDDEDDVFFNDGTYLRNHIR